MGDQSDAFDEDELDIRLRAPREAADRMLALAAVCRRAFLERRPEDLAGDADEDEEDEQAGEDAETERFDLAAWARESRIDAAATPDELRLLHARIGRLSPDDTARATWAGEALVALAWAVGLVEPAPPYDQSADIGDLLAEIPSPWDDPAPFRRTLALLPEERIAREREIAELWRWRAGAEALAREADDAERRELRAVAREVAAEAHNAGFLDALIAGDFAALGQPISQVPRAALDEIATLSEQRLRALNWLCGFGASWDAVPLDL